MVFRFCSGLLDGIVVIWGLLQRSFYVLPLKLMTSEVGQGKGLRATGVNGV